MTLHYITLHYITWHDITLHYITYIHTYITYIHTYIYYIIYTYLNERRPGGYDIGSCWWHGLFLLQAERSCLWHSNCLLVSGPENTPTGHPQHHLILGNRTVWQPVHPDPLFSLRSQTATSQLVRLAFGTYIYIYIYIHTYIHTYIHYITLHYITLHYIKLHYITLHYITYIHTFISMYIYIYKYTYIYI